MENSDYMFDFFISGYFFVLHFFTIFRKYLQPTHHIKTMLGFFFLWCHQLVMFITWHYTLWQNMTESYLSLVYDQEFRSSRWRRICQRMCEMRHLDWSLSKGQNLNALQNTAPGRYRWYTHVTLRTTIWMKKYNRKKSTVINLASSQADPGPAHPPPTPHSPVWIWRLFFRFWLQNTHIL